MIRHLWRFIRSLFWRPGRPNACRGPIFDDPREARSAFADIPSRGLVESPYVYVCDAGHWHAQTTRIITPPRD